MDLFDTGAYFARKVPILAASRPLLRAAACAIAARHFARNNTPNLTMYQRGYGLALEYCTIDWAYKSAEYYDQAIGLLMEAACREEEQQGLTRKKTRSDEIVAAIAILSMYELMDAPGPEWKAHLSALPLLDISSFKVSGPQSQIHPHRSITRRSIFWSFARQDCLAACKRYLNRVSSVVDSLQLLARHARDLILTTFAFGEVWASVLTKTACYFRAKL